MKLSVYYDHDPRHWRFVRVYTDTPVIECHDAGNGFRWAVAAAVAVLSLLAMAI